MIHLKKKAVVVVGATASGKTALGVHIAKNFGGEVISADSMQIYKTLSISTAKPTLDEMCGVTHHLIDFLPLSEKYSVSNYCRDARQVFDELSQKSILPVIVGGTGLYIDSFISNTQFIEDAFSDKVRSDLQNELQEKGINELYKELCSVDPVAAEKIHPNNKVRVLRALEVYRATGKTITWQAEASHNVESDIEPLFIGINYRDREKLYERINKRVDIMLESGLLDEVELFMQSSPSQTAYNAIGCKELIPYLSGQASLDECVENLKRETRRYAKRQITWFKRNKNINWFYADELSADELYFKIDSLIKEYLGGDFNGN